MDGLTWAFKQSRNAQRRKLVRISQLIAQPKQVKTLAAQPVNDELDRPRGEKSAQGTVLLLARRRLIGGPVASL